MHTRSGGSSGSSWLPYVVAGQRSAGESLMLTWIAFGLLAAALVLFLNLRRQRKLGGLPAGELLLADHAQENCPVLVSHRYGLKGT